MTAITPGKYLKLRRIAAGLSLADVAARLHVEPHRFNERARVEWLELIECDAQPLDIDLAVALKLTPSAHGSTGLFPFDMRVLLALTRIAQGFPDNEPQLCRDCGCSWEDPCFDKRRMQACSWASPDLCTACKEPEAVAAEIPVAA